MPKLFQKQKCEWENFYFDGEIGTLKEKEIDWECFVCVYIYREREREGTCQRERDFFFYLVLNFTLIRFFF